MKTGIPTGIVATISRKGEKKIGSFIKIPDFDDLDERDIEIDADGIYRTLTYIYTLSYALQKYYLRESVNKIKLAQGPGFNEILRFLGLASYIGKRATVAITGNPEDYMQPSPYVEEFFIDYTYELSADLSKEASMIQKDMRSMTRAGRPLDEIRDELMGKYGMLKARANSIAVTETTRAYASGILMSSHSSTEVRGYEFIAVLDSHTTNICRARNGKVIPKSDENMISLNTPPLHVNCRSHLSPIISTRKIDKWLDQKEYDRMSTKHPETIPQKRKIDVNYTRELLRNSRP